MRFPPDAPIVCFSHLRWNFVFQRPQHVLSRLSASREVFYVEEPVFKDAAEPRLADAKVLENVTVLCAHLPAERRHEAEEMQRRLLSAFLRERRILDAIFWYYTPMAFPWTDPLPHSMCVYDCMDELSMFAFAPDVLQEREAALLAKASVVFTGGRSLYYRKRRHHRNVQCFPSAVDAGHFRPRSLPEPDDLAAIGRPRFGFYGVVDERFDCRLLGDVALLRPHWQFVIVGPIAKIDPQSLPRRENIHYIGQRSYDELPAHLHHWDIAMLPFALNDATRFISPTKTLEYLAARKPVISTPIADVVDPYGKDGLVGIASGALEFVAIAEDVLKRGLRARWFACDRSRRRRAFVGRNGCGHAQRIGRRRTASRTRMKHFDYLIVGAGFAGAVLAERLANDAGKTVLARRPAPAHRRQRVRRSQCGRSADPPLRPAHLSHEFGRGVRLFGRVSRSGAPTNTACWQALMGNCCPMPINLDTINRLYGLELREHEVEAFLAARAERVEKIRTSEDAVVSRIGRDLYEKFFKYYTRKQWGLDPSRARRLCHLAHSRTRKPRRPLLQRYVPGDAAARLHAHVRKHARSRRTCGSSSASISDRSARV